MSALRCRRYPTTDMTASREKMSDCSPRKGRSAKRKLLDDEILHSPAKVPRTRTNLKPNIQTTLSDTSVSPPEKMAPNSFYGGARNKYISPLERKEQRENFSFVSPISPSELTKPKYASPLVGKAARKTIVKRATSGRPTIKHKSFKQKERNIVIQSTKSSEQSLNISETPSEKENMNESADSVPDTPNSSGKKTNRFFKHRASPGEEAKARGSRVVLRKGFNLTYYRTANNSTVNESVERKNLNRSSPSDGGVDKTSMMLALSKIRQTRERAPEMTLTEVKDTNPYSQDMFSDTSDYSRWFEDEDTDSVLDENKRVTRSQSPMKKYSADSTCSSPLRERNKKFDSVTISPMSSSVDSAMADSVLLMSSISSIKSDSLTSGTPKSSPYNQKLFSIFSSKASPGSKASKSSSTTSSPQSSATSSPKQQRKSSRHVLRSLRDRDGKEQMILDFGQKLGTATQCNTCGMTYTDGEPSDEATHSKFHQNVITTLKFSGWKKERICQDNPDGSRIVVITSEDKFAAKKVEAVRNIVDTELGFVVERRKLIPGMKTFLYISEDKQIIGCCIAQEIRKGFRVLAENSSEGSPLSTGKPWCCSMKPEPAKCGISRIWVLASRRGQKIATQLLDCVRFHFILGHCLSKEELAFSDPTPDGRSFATRYTDTPCFLVYKLEKLTLSQ